MIDEFDQSKSYEWIGSFWFPSAEEKKYAGKLTYTPELGIQLDLTNIGDFDHDMRSLSKKIMHAVVQGEKPVALTLFNVFLSVGGVFGNPTLNTLQGNAACLIADELLEDIHFDKVACEYGDRLTNIFLLPMMREADALRFSKSKPIHLDGGEKISMDVFSSGTTIYSSEDLETVFWTFDKKIFERFKRALKPLLKEKPYFLHRRMNSKTIIVLEKEKQSLDDLLEMERFWRSF